MKKEYQSPEVEVVSLVTEEITNGLVGGSIGTEEVPDDFIWD